MIWQELINIYDTQRKERHICPIAHTQITAHIGILLDNQANILAAAKIQQSVFAPCTAQSECRTSNVAPHLVHDNASYVSNINKKRHDAYMAQLEEFVEDTDDYFCKIVLDYLKKETICDNLSYLIDLADNPTTNIVFGIRGCEENEINQTWIDYYLSKLPTNGICSITREADYIPDAYPRNIRNSSDFARLFVTNSDELNSMPKMRPGYIASQKIIHTAQSFFVGWKEQGTIPLTDVVIRGNRPIITDRE